MAPLLLTRAELVELTRREQPAAQARVLRALGIPCRAHPTDGVLIVSREAALRVLGELELAATADAPAEDDYQVNVTALRRLAHHGTQA